MGLRGWKKLTLMRWKEVQLLKICYFILYALVHSEIRWVWSYSTKDRNFMKNPLEALKICSIFLFFFKRILMCISSHLFGLPLILWSSVCFLHPIELAHYFYVQYFDMTICQSQISAIVYLETTSLNAEGIITTPICRVKTFTKNWF